MDDAGVLAGRIRGRSQTIRHWSETLASAKTLKKPNLDNLTLGKEHDIIIKRGDYMDDVRFYEDNQKVMKKLANVVEGLNMEDMKSLVVLTKTCSIDGTSS